MIAFIVGAAVLAVPIAALVLAFAGGPVLVAAAQAPARRAGPVLPVPQHG